MRNRLAALFQEGVLEFPPLEDAPPSPAPRVGDEADGFAGIPGLKVVAEVPLLEASLRPTEQRRAAVAPPTPAADRASYPLDPRVEDPAALDARIQHLERKGILCRARYWVVVALSVALAVALGLVFLS